MNPILGLFAAPSAMGLAQQTAKAAASPFDLLLQAAGGSAESDSTAASGEQQDEAPVLHEGIARQLQELFASLGVNAGDQMRLSEDEETGAIRVEGHPLAGEVEAAIADQPSLTADLQELLGTAAGASTGLTDAELQVEAAEGHDLAILEWR